MGNSKKNFCLIPIQSVDMKSNPSREHIVNIDDSLINEINDALILQRTP